MFNAKQDQWLNQKFSQDTNLLIWIEAFLIDRKAQNMAKGTLYFYTKKLNLFTNFCESQAVKEITQIDANLIRKYLLFLESSGHNPGGCHQGYRTLKTFLKWWFSEVEPEGFKNPIEKVKAPKNRIEPLEPIELETINALLATCKSGSLIGLRDKAIIYCLLDTGARASEFISINLADFNLINGEILIRQGKGRKPRFVYLGEKSRKVIRQYLKRRNDNNPALWITDDGDKLSYWGLKAIFRRRSKMAGVICPEIHSFRRFFALNMLRAGADILSASSYYGENL